MKIEELNVKIYSDGADLDSFSSLCNNPIIKGFTTNPTLMRKAGIQDYAGFANQALKIVKGKPISFEVFTEHTKLYCYLPSKLNFVTKTNFLIFSHVSFL